MRDSGGNQGLQPCLLFEEVSETLYVLGELRPVRAGLIVRRNAVTFAAGALVKVSSATRMPSVAAQGNKAESAIMP